MSAQAALTTFGDASGARFYAGESWVELARSLIMTSADANEVEHAIQRAHEYAEQTGGRLLSARVIEAQARLAAREGHTDVSLMRLREAAEAYRTFGATPHAKRIELELAESTKVWNDCRLNCYFVPQAQEHIAWGREFK